MKRKEPQKGFLYTWNMIDGFLGHPKRRIDLRGIRLGLMHVAHLAGGPGWDNRTPEGGVLCLWLDASWRPQSEDAYCRFYDHYAKDMLAKKYDAQVEELTGGDRASWTVEIKRRWCTDEELDAVIRAVLNWHNREIERIRSLLRKPR